MMKIYALNCSRITVLLTCISLSLVSCSSDEPVTEPLADFVLQSIHDFESLTANAFLHQQDYWVDHAGSGQAIVAIDASNTNGSQVVQPLLTTALNAPVFLTRENESGHTFGMLESDAGNQYIQLDLTAEGRVLLAIGHDVNADGHLNGTAGETGPSFGIVDSHFRIQGAASGSVTDIELGSGNALFDWYRLRMTVKTDAATGLLTGSLHYMNLSKGDNDFKDITYLQNIDLQTERLNSNADPTAWDAIWLHLQATGGRTPSADNIIPHAITNDTDQ